MQPDSTTSPLFGDPRLPARFWEKVRIGSVPDYRPDLGPCWEWTAATGDDGYGRFYNGCDERGRKITRRAHRYSYEALIGPIVSGLVLDHLCRNPPCVNPPHLESVAPRLNTKRGLRSVALRGGLTTQCPKGHVYTPKTTIYRKDGRVWWCRPCRNEYARELYKRQRIQRLAYQRAWRLKRQQANP